MQACACKENVKHGLFACRCAGDFPQLAGREAVCPHSRSPAVCDARPCADDIGRGDDRVGAGGVAGGGGLARERRRGGGPRGFRARCVERERPCPGGGHPGQRHCQGWHGGVSEQCSERLHAAHGGDDRAAEFPAGRGQQAPRPAGGRQLQPARLLRHQQIQAPCRGRPAHARLQSRRTADPNRHAAHRRTRRHSGRGAALSRGRAHRRRRRGGRWRQQPAQHLRHDGHQPQGGRGCGARRADRLWTALTHSRHQGLGGRHRAGLCGEHDFAGSRHAAGRHWRGSRWFCAYGQPDWAAALCGRNDGRCDRRNPPGHHRGP